MDEGANGDFFMKALKQMVNLKILGEEADMDETKWCKYIPNKVSVFMWRLKHGRLPVRAILDRYGMDLDTTLCPVCNEVVETLDHCFVSCCKAKSVWNKVFDWWSLDSVDGSSIADILNVDGTGFFPNSLKPVWLAVVWSVFYFLWKFRNKIVFQGPQNSEVDLVFEIQLISFFWIKHRVKSLNLNWVDWCLGPIRCHK